MHFIQGQRVSVKNHRGDRVAKRVWSENDGRVFVTSDEVFALLLSEATQLSPIGVPKEDVEPMD